MNPMWELFDYACDKFYYIEYGNECRPNAIKGLLLNYGSHCAILAERGLYIIRMKEINVMYPIPMPQNLSDDFRKLIETYLKERAKQDDKNA